MTSDASKSYATSDATADDLMQIERIAMELLLAYPRNTQKDLNTRQLTAVAVYIQTAYCNARYLISGTTLRSTYADVQVIADRLAARIDNNN